MRHGLTQYYHSVCGAKHSPSRFKTFWIQCESCNSWYHVAENCIGFDDQQANCPNFVWNCAACVPDSESDEEIVPSNNNSGHTRALQLDKAKHDCSQQRNRCEDELHKQSAEREESMIFVNDTTREICPVNPSEPQPHTDLASEPTSELILPKGRSENKLATPLALEQLKSHNRDGSSYWETLKAEQLPNNPDRCLRKRKFTTNKREQHRIDGGGEKDQTLLSTKPKNKKRGVRSNKVEGKLKDTGENKRQTLSQRARSRSVRERVEPKIESDDDSSVTPTMVPNRRFEVGDLVYVEDHAWAYVNNSGGIGLIHKTYISDDGDHVYDVKYPALDRTEKRIMAEFISPYCFD
jgi:hypothetical protein